jgi:hypothetical protein
MKARDVMASPVVTVKPSFSVTEAAKPYKFRMRIAHPTARASDGGRSKRRSNPMQEATSASGKPDVPSSEELSRLDPRRSRTDFPHCGFDEH